MLMETVKAAEGRSDVDSSMMDALNDEPAPADFELTTPTSPSFGIPEPDDPDPFGVLALEKEGLEIREAGTKSRPPSSQFEYNPSPTSPVYGKFHRKSMDTLATRSNRDSYMSSRSMRTMTSMDRATQTAEMGTQTDEPISPITSPTHSHSHEKRIEEEEDEKPLVVEPIPSPEEVDYTKIDLGPYSNLNHNQSQEFDGTTVNESPREQDVEHNAISVDVSDEEEEEEEEPVIFEAASAQAQMLTPSAIKARGGLVNIPKRPPPPPLPPRSMARASRSAMVDQGSGRSPARSEFEEVDLHGVDVANRRSVDSKRISMQSSRLSVDDKRISVQSNRKSVEEEKGIVMEDLEQAETEPKLADLETTKTVEPKPQSPEEKFEHALEEQHIDTITPSVDEKSEIEQAVKNESNEMNDAIEVDEKDDFHSVPSTPNEVLVK
jgi:hypothetical protein